MHLRPPQRLDMPVPHEKEQGHLRARIPPTPDPRHHRARHRRLLRLRRHNPLPNQLGRSSPMFRLCQHVPRIRCHMRLWLRNR